MPNETAPYKLTIKLTSSRADAVGEALTELRQMMSDYDQSGKTATTVVLESYKEAPLTEIANIFELWLYRYKIGLECDMNLHRPGLRPETIVAMRAAHATPMDKQGWDEAEPESDEPLITPPPWEPLQLAAPNDADEGEIVEELTVEEA